jgi:predicted nuclease of predicted toxin-antitoxin system
LSLRLYLDQMLRVEVAERLRREGHDVVRASERGAARADDSEILAAVRSEGRILVTLDAHFGDWTVLPLSRHWGVIRLRIHPTTSAKAIGVLLPLLENRRQEEFRGYLVIASERGTRWVRTEP